MGRGIFTFSFVLMFLVPYIFGCSKLEYGARAVDTGHMDDTDERKVYYSDVVVYGIRKETVTGNYPFKDVSGVETIMFHVLCTYKAKGGPKIPKTIYIAGIGNMNGELKDCPPVSFGSFETAIMFLKRTKRADVFEAEFKPNTGEVDIILDDLSVVCGLDLSQDNNTNTCEDFPPLNDDEGCVSWTPIKLEKPEKEEPEPESGEENPEPKPNDKDKDGTVVDIDQTDDGKNNQSDKGYETKTEPNKPDTGKNTGTASGSKEDGNGSSTIFTASLLVTLITVFLTIVV